MNSMEAMIARLDERMTERFTSLGKQMDSIEAEQKAASESRRRSYEAQERTEREMISIKHRIDSVEKSIETIRPTTDELERVRYSLRFSGKLGHMVWSIGKAVIAATAGAAAAWYAITGRPPP